MLFSSFKPPPAVSKGNHTPQFSTLNLSRVYCKVTHFSGDMQAFSALFSGGREKSFRFLDKRERSVRMGSLGVWEFRSLGVWTIPKVIIPLRSQLSALNSKCAEQPSGNSEGVQSFPAGIVVHAGMRRAQFCAG